MIEILGLDSGEYRRFRRLWIEIGRELRNAPRLFRQIFGFPDSLPNLTLSKPPENSRPLGIATSWYRQREEGTLPDSY